MEFGTPLHTDGKYKGLPQYEQKLWEIKTGGRTTLVASVIVWSPHGDRGHLCRGLQYNQFFRLKAAVPKGCEKITFVNAVVTHNRGPNVSLDEKSAILGHEPREAHDYFRLVELCTGVGALGHGAKIAGWTVEAQNEIQSSFCDHLRHCGSKIVVEGDLCKLSTIVEIHRLAPKAGAMAWGFSCQPFSKLGDQQHGSDPRAQTLPYGLYASYLLQKDLLVLECVPQAATSQFVQQCLNFHIAMTRVEKSETLLELGQLWPSSRRRWWCVLMHESFPKINFREFPSMPQKPIIQHVLPDWLDLSADEIAQLTLEEHERQAFATHKPGIDKQLIGLQDALPTALHSWGNQCQHCKCGCRPSFSHARLQDHGLFGALVKVKGASPNQDLRHVSPKEMALLCGYPKTEGWDTDQRLLMAAIGQLASPIQSAWVFGHIRELLQEYQFGDITPAHPKHIVACVCLEVLKLRDAWVPSTEHTVAMSLFQEQIEMLLEPQQTVVPTASGEGQDQYPQVESSDLMVSVQGSTTSEHGSTQDTFNSCEGGIGEPTSLDQLDKAILAQADDKPSLSPGNRGTKRKEIPGAVIGFGLYDNNTPTRSNMTAEDRQPVMSPGASHVLDRWCTNQGDVANADPSAETARVPVVETPSNPNLPDERPTSIEESDTFRNGATPQDILDNKVLVWDRATNTIMAIACKPGSTGGDLLKATQAMDGRKTMVLEDILGRAMDLTLPLQPGQIVGIGTAKDLKADDMTFHHAEQWLSQMPRWYAALRQGARVAHDEMHQYLGAIASQYRIDLATPLLLDTWGDTQIQEWKAHLQANQHVVSAILVGGHWIPVIAHTQNEVAIITIEQGVSLLHNIFPDATVVSGKVLESKFQHDCGFQALAWLVAEVTQQAVVNPFTWAQACSWRQLFWHRIYADHTAMNHVTLCLGGHEDSLVIAISALLKEHGVQAEQLQERSQTMLSRLGVEPIKEAIQSNRPWQKLKQLANQCSPPLRLVAPEELERVLAEKAKAGKPIGDRTSKDARTTAPTQISIGPQDIIIPTGVFSQEDGTLVPQLQFRQIGSKARGVVVAIESEVQPYIASGCIASEGLAFLVLHPSRSLQEVPGQWFVSLPNVPPQENQSWFQHTWFRRASSRFTEQFHLSCPKSMKFQSPRSNCWFSGINYPWNGRNFVNPQLSIPLDLPDAYRFAKSQHVSVNSGIPTPWLIQARQNQF